MCSRKTLETFIEPFVARLGATPRETPLGMTCEPNNGNYPLISLEIVSPYCPFHRHQHQQRPIQKSTANTIDANKTWDFSRAWKSSIKMDAKLNYGTFRRFVTDKMPSLFAWMADMPRHGGLHRNAQLPYWDTAPSTSVVWQLVEMTNDVRKQLIVKWAKRFFLYVA